VLCLLFFAAACAPQSQPAAATTAASTPAPSGTADPTLPSSQVGEVVEALDQVATVIALRTPVPQPGSRLVADLAESIADQSGLAGAQFLGFPISTWINILVSALLFVLLVFLGVRLLFSLLRAVVRRTKTRFDDEFLESIERELRWLVIVLLAGYAFLRLDIWGAGLRIVLTDAFFLLGLGVIYLIGIRLVTFAMDWYRKHGLPAAQRRRLDPFLELVKRLGYVLVSLLGLSSALNHFGVEITLLSVIILFGALIAAIGARAAIADAVSGFVILVSQPFRVGDAVYVKELDTRGDVEAIGIRTTHIRTRDGREVIVPNSLIASSQVVNYTYPDPNYRVEIEFSAAGAEFDQLRRIVEDVVRSVEGVLPGRPVDVYYVSLGGSGTHIRVRWWVDHINNRTRVLSRVNNALDRALTEAGIRTPDPAYDLRLKEVAEPPSRLSANTGEGDADGSG
jgi:small-conductance mechanosensitive channel